MLAMRRRDIFGFAATVAAWPLVARASDPSRVPKIGVLWHAANSVEEAPYFTSLIEGFRSLGYGEGRITLEHRFPAEKPELFTSMAAELAAMNPDAIIAVDNKGRITEFNEEAAKLLDYPSRHEIFGRKVSELYWGGVEEALKIQTLLEEEEDQGCRSFLSER